MEITSNWGGFVMSVITPEEVEKLLETEEITLIDVRESDEVAFEKIPGVLHIPLGELNLRLGELNKETKYVIVCRSGNRSGIATHLMNLQGYRALNMVGGMLQWKGKVVSTV